jgi:dTDP-4-dehydrorhamnose 3,5-epimerase
MMFPKLHSQELSQDSRGYNFKFPNQNSQSDAVHNQILVSFNNDMGTFRGMHWQQSPYLETKFVAVLNGKILDFVVNIDLDSEDFGKVFNFEISNDGSVLEIPPMHAHGYLTLTNDVMVVYGIRGTFEPNQQRGFRWNDPLFKLALPFDPLITSPRDNQFPDFQPELSR